MTTDVGIRALGLASRGLLVVVPAIGLAMYAAGMPATQLQIMAAMMAWAIAIRVLHLRDRHAAAIALLVCGLILFAAIFAAAYGSVRAAGTVLIVAAMAAAGLLLERRALIATLLLGAVAVAALIAAENAGLIGPPAYYSVGAVHGAIYVATFTAVGLIAHYVRSQLLDALGAAKSSSERFAKAFDLVPVSLTISRAADGKILAVNAADARHLGYTREEVLGRSTLETAWVDPEDRVRFLAALDSQDSVAGFEAQHRNSSGEAVDVQLWASRFEFGGEPCVLTACLNVTQRKRDERLLLETAAGVAGETGDRLFRSLVQHLATTMGCEIALCGELVENDRLHAHAMVKDGAPVQHVGLSIAGTPSAALPDDGQLMVTPFAVGRKFPAALELVDARVQSHIGMLLRNAKGEPVGVLAAYSYRPMVRSASMEALFRIFAARAEAELRNLQRDRQVQRLQQSLEQRVDQRTADLKSFSYSVSHDLRAPLRAISGMSSILRRDYAASLAPEALRYLDRLDEGATQMGRLVDGLLELSRVGLEPMSPRAVDMQGLVASRVRELAAGAGQARFEIGELPPSFGEPRLLETVWRHLLENAVKYSRAAAEPRILVEARQEASGVRYSVRDNGAGFDSQYADKLFQVFERLDPGSGLEGTGIGLAIVKRIVARHGGTVGAEGTPGGGACFYFTLPGDRRSQADRLSSPARAEGSR